MARNKDRDELRPDFEIQRVTLLPGDEGGLVQAIKPGHWVAVNQDMVANHFDFVGRWEASVVDQANRPILLERTPFRLTTTRAATLPKGQHKQLETTFFAPGTDRPTRVATILRGPAGGQAVPQSPELFSPMPPYQYYFVVLAREPDQYTYVNVLDSVRAPADDLFALQAVPAAIYYRVVRPKVDPRIELPSHALVWSSIAYVLWDDVEPTTLSPRQQVAVVDWLHWGGQLILDGPGSLDGVGDSFLAPYLPARAVRACSYGNDALRELNAIWSKRPGRTTAPLAAVTPWSGIQLELLPGGTLVPGTGGLLAERFVGRGRVVVSAVRLTERDLLSWPGFDGFFNACLLRRPPRRYVTDQNGLEVHLTWADTAQKRFDSGLVSGVRYFTRDAGRKTDVAPAMSAAGAVPGPGRQAARVSPPAGLGGVASWSAFSPVANAARQTLREAAGIVIPRSSFVLQVLAVYLIVLVPLNWALFRALGHVEWAWLAAPVIAVACALAVIKWAQLDIGFARSRIELAVVEAHAGYARAVVTRYNALYTSLSASYDLEFDDPGAVAQPFPVDKGFELLRGQKPTIATYQQGPLVRLANVRIDSNTTGMVHSEQMLDLGGSILLRQTTADTLRLDNQTQYALHDAVVVREVAGKGHAARLQVCQVGTLAAGASTPMKFRSVDEKRFAAVGPTVASAAGSDPIDLGDLTRLALNPSDFQPGETRLVARLNEPLPGLRVEPAAAQFRAATLVVVHLAQPPRRPPRPDVNAKPDTMADPLGP